MPSIVPSSSPSDVTTGQGGQSVSTHRTAAEAANGDYRIVWQNAAQGSTYGVYTRLFGPDGTPQGNALYIAGTGIADGEATIAMNANGAFAIAWTHTVGQTQSVMMERFDATGNPIGSPVTVASALKGGSTHQPSVAMDTAGDVALAYTDSGPGSMPTMNQVKGILYGHGGTSTPLAVTPWTATTQPSVAMNAAGTFVVAFTRDVGVTNQDVYAQRFKAGGVALGSAVAVATSTDREDQPSAAIDAQGDFVIAYTDIRSSQPFHQPPFVDCTDYRSEVHAVLFNPQGGVTKAETVWASTKATESGYDPSAAMDAAGDFVIGYTRGGNLGGYVPADGAPDVWASAYTKAGAVQQAGINLSVNSLKPQPSPDGHNPGPWFLNDYRPSVALSPTGHLVADWENFGLNLNGDVAGTSVFTQTFVNAPFQYQLKDGIVIPVWGGMPAAYHIAITRDPGFTGPIAVSFSNLPPGVTYTVSADSHTPSEVLTVTFNSDDAVPWATMAAAVLKITGGGVALTPTVYFNVTPSAITGWTGDDGPTLVNGFTATISGTGFVPGSTVRFGTNGPTATPTQIDPGGKWLTVVVPLNAAAGPITILRPGGKSIVSATSPTYTEGGVTGLDEHEGYAPGYSAQYLDTGSEVVVHGFGFQPDVMVIFGDPSTDDGKQLSDVAQQAGVGAKPTYIDPSGTWLKVNVPRYAVDGSVYVVEPDGTALQSPDQFHVNNYRNTFGFSFENFKFNVTWDDVKNEFGAEQVDIYGPVPHGVFPFMWWEWGDSGVPTPLSLEVWAILAAAFNQNGACYGMALTSVLMSAEYHPDWINAGNGLPDGAAPTVFNLQMNDALGSMIEQNHLAQASGEVISAFLNWQAGSQSATDVYNQIHDALVAGDHPVVSIQAGAQHSVVAYDLEPATNGGYYIDVYDPNRPFDDPVTFDSNEYESIGSHVWEEQISRIHIDAAGNWSFQMASGQSYGGGFGTLEVLPAGLVAYGVTFPVTPGGLLQVGNFLAGSSAPGGCDAKTTAFRSTAGPATLGLDPVDAPRTVASPASPRPLDAAFLTSAHDDIALPVAQARVSGFTRVGPGKHADPVGSDSYDLCWQDRDWLSDPWSAGRLVVV
jgi:hypothetical protein